MKFFVTGVCSQLGHDVMNEIIKRGYEVLGSDLMPEYSGTKDDSPASQAVYMPLDITDHAMVQQVFEAYRPDVVIHCAQWTPEDMGVDQTTTEKMTSINVEGTKNIAEACKGIDAKMIYHSNVAVFDGQGTEPWKPDCENTNPINAYGQTKLDGEKAVKSILEKYFIVRTGWVFGPAGSNFANSVLKEGIIRGMLYMVTDQFGTPTYTCDLARLLVDMGESDKYGCYHAANSGGYVSSFHYASEIFKQAQLAVTVAPMTTEKCWLSSAPKPYNSMLDTTKLAEQGFEPLPDWKDAIDRYLTVLGI